MNKEFGRVGESLARGYLRQLGIEIIHAPFSCRCGEIDIIAREGRTLAFIEVKARRNSTCGAPVEAVSWAKQQR
ncbi:YraN family protein, partial [bacterium]|nr:YraN family protein [candidate division CSSED10-310 bacterium]